MKNCAILQFFWIFFFVSCQENKPVAWCETLQEYGKY
jgi:hypothetical protein